MWEMIISQKIYNYIMNNGRCKNKFWAFAWRDACYLGILLGIIFLLMGLWVGNKLMAFQVAGLVLVWIITVAVGVILHYRMLSKK